MIRFGFTIILMSVVLLGCQQQDSSVNVKEAVKEVYIFNSSEFKKESSGPIVSSSDTDNPAVFKIVKSILSDATKQDGVVDMVEPNYYLEIIYTDDRKKEIFLWLVDAEGGKGSLMEVEDTHTIYNFSEEMNTQLIDLIDSNEN